jgi:hypothetical protein
MKNVHQSMINPDELLGVLHADYCEALGSSGKASIGAWENAEDPHVRVSEDLPPEPELGAGEKNMVSISELLSEPQRLEDAIGPLIADPWLADASSLPPVPEILQLFAPAEYHTGAARRRSAAPPVLARREHHALAIDSPLPALFAGAASAQ